MPHLMPVFAATGFAHQRHHPLSGPPPPPHHMYSHHLVNLNATNTTNGVTSIAATDSTTTKTCKGFADMHMVVKPCVDATSSATAAAAAKKPLTKRTRDCKQLKKQHQTKKRKTKNSKPVSRANASVQKLETAAAAAAAEAAAIAVATTKPVEALETHATAAAVVTQTDSSAGLVPLLQERLYSLRLRISCVRSHLKPECITSANYVASLGKLVVGTYTGNVLCFPATPSVTGSMSLSVSSDYVLCTFSRRIVPYHSLLDECMASPADASMTSSLAEMLANHNHARYNLLSQEEKREEERLWCSRSLLEDDAIHYATLVAETTMIAVTSRGYIHLWEWRTEDENFVGGGDGDDDNNNRSSSSSAGLCVYMQKGPYSALRDRNVLIQYVDREKLVGVSVSTNQLFVHYFGFFRQQQQQQQPIPSSSSIHASTANAHAKDAHPPESVSTSSSHASVNIKVEPGTQPQQHQQHQHMEDFPIKTEPYTLTSIKTEIKQEFTVKQEPCSSSSSNSSNSSVQEPNIKVEIKREPGCEYQVKQEKSDVHASSSSSTCSRVTRGGGASVGSSSISRSRYWSKDVEIQREYITIDDDDHDQEKKEDEEVPDEIMIDVDHKEEESGEEDELEMLSDHHQEQQSRDSVTETSDKHEQQQTQQEQEQNTSSRSNSNSSSKGPKDKEDLYCNFLYVVEGKGHQENCFCYYCRNNQAVPIKCEKMDNEEQEEEQDKENLLQDGQLVLLQQQQPATLVPHPLSCVYANSWKFLQQPLGPAGSFIRELYDVATSSSSTTAAAAADDSKRQSLCGVTDCASLLSKVRERSLHKRTDMKLFDRETTETLVQQQHKKQQQQQQQEYKLFRDHYGQGVYGEKLEMLLVSSEFVQNKTALVDAVTTKSYAISTHRYGRWTAILTSDGSLVVEQDQEIVAYHLLGWWKELLATTVRILGAGKLLLWNAHGIHIYKWDYQHHHTLSITPAMQCAARSGMEEQLNSSKTPIRCKTIAPPMELVFTFDKGNSQLNGLSTMVIHDLFTVDGRFLGVIYRSLSPFAMPLFSFHVFEV